MVGESSILFPAEWSEQDGVMVTWPDKGTDWAGLLDDAEQVFIAIASEIVKREKLIIVCRDKVRVGNNFSEEQKKSIRIVELPYNDTWARDHGPLSILNNGHPTVLDFGFNGWGDKYNACLDNQISVGLFRKGLFSPETGYIDCNDFILEGGSIETDGQGTILTTSACLLNPNRNPWYSKSDIEDKLQELLGVNRFLWLDYGHLEGDDTDSHIDTLARFCDEKTIAYVQCSNQEDAHFEELSRMEVQLKTFKDQNGHPYHLIPLPMVSPLFNEEGQRMGATYANFLIINGAVLVPVYGVQEDVEAIKIIEGIFPGREVVGINCLPLIRQNGSLHCITMQIPKGFLA